MPGLPKMIREHGVARGDRVVHFRQRLLSRPRRANFHDARVLSARELFVPDEKRVGILRISGYFAKCVRAENVRDNEDSNEQEMRSAAMRARPFDVEKTRENS